MPKKPRTLTVAQVQAAIAEDPKTRFVILGFGETDAYGKPHEVARNARDFPKVGSVVRAFIENEGVRSSVFDEDGKHVAGYFDLDGAALGAPKHYFIAVRLGRYEEPAAKPDIFGEALDALHDVSPDILLLPTEYQDRLRRAECALAKLNPQNPGALYAVRTAIEAIRLVLQHPRVLSPHAQAAFVNGAQVASSCVAQAAAHAALDALANIR